MSGPKVLSPEEIEAQRLAEERLNLLQEINQKHQELQRQIDKGELAIARLDCVGNEGEIKSLSNRIEQHCGKTSKLAMEIKKAYQTTDNEKIKVYLNLLENAINQNSSDMMKDIRKAESIHKRFVEARVSSLASAPDSVQKINQVDLSEKDIQQEYQFMLKTCEILEKRGKRIHFDTSEVSRILSDIKLCIRDSNRERRMIYEELHRIDVFRLSVIRRKLDEAESDFDMLDKKLSDLLASYYNVCQCMGVKPKKFPFSEKSIHEINYECSRLKTQRVGRPNHSDSLRKVRNALNTMGYHFLGEKNEGNAVYRQIFRVPDTVNTVIHVLFDADGKVTMEVAVEDQCERLPTARETETIVSAQHSFCNVFEDIFTALNRNGLGLSLEEDYPCGPEFAQVIDTSDFDYEPAEEEAFDEEEYMNPETKYMWEG